MGVTSVWRRSAIGETIRRFLTKGGGGGAAAIPNTVFFLGILLHIPCIFPLQGLLEYIHGLLQEYVRRSIPGVHIPKSPGIEHLRISWIFGSPVLKHPEVVLVAIPGMLSLS